MAVVRFYPSSYTPNLSKGSYTNPANAYADDTAYAVLASNQRNDTNGITYTSFDFSSIPTNATINSVTVMANIYYSTSGTTDYLHLEARKSGILSGTTGELLTEPQSDYLFNHSNTGTWTVGDLANLTVYLEHDKPNTTQQMTLNIDFIAVDVDYTIPVHSASTNLTGSMDDNVTISAVLFGQATSEGAATLTATVAKRENASTELTGTASMTANGTRLIENGFEIQRKVNTGDFEVIAIVDGSTYAYDDYDLEAGNTYAYRVRRIQNFVLSDYSNEYYFDANSLSVTAEVNLTGSASEAIAATLIEVKYGTATITHGDQISAVGEKHTDTTSSTGHGDQVAASGEAGKQTSVADSLGDQLAAIGSKWVDVTTSESIGDQVATTGQKMSASGIIDSLGDIILATGDKIAGSSPTLSNGDQVVITAFPSRIVSVDLSDGDQSNLSGTKWVDGTLTLQHGDQTNATGSIGYSGAAIITHGDQASAAGDKGGEGTASISAGDLFTYTYERQDLRLIMRLTNTRHLIVDGELIEGTSVNLDSVGNLEVVELIEGDTVAMDATGVLTVISIEEGDL